MDPWSRARELAGGVLRYPPYPEKTTAIFCHSRRIEKLCLRFINSAHKRPIVFLSYAWPAPAACHLFVASGSGSTDCMAVYGWMFQVMYYWPPTRKGHRRSEPPASPLATSDVKSHIFHNSQWHQPVRNCHLKRPNEHHRPLCEHGDPITGDHSK